MKQDRPYLLATSEFGSQPCLLCLLTVSEFINGRAYRLSIGCTGYFHDECAKKLKSYGLVEPITPLQIPTGTKSAKLLPRCREPTTILQALLPNPIRFLKP
ncbi:hypothetical protein [Ammoniphilus resinae]|uniref:RING-type domain-containing protein n=1 Tax=Ammoniphilus resinae TaxID=861532 RepID=A0ABS4GX31_9BACL|nr:hypothetical protein [Ammoniphilus resinae]MBP1934832.1 hypothetical protein [Ammoniphilus resinae]